VSPFDKYLHAVITRAQHEAGEDCSPTVEAQHLLLAVSGEPDPVREVLTSAGLDTAALRDALEREFASSLSAVGVPSSTYGLPKPSPRRTHPGIGTSAKLALERGFSSAPRKKDLRPAHVLLGILSAEVGTVPRALALAGVNREDLLTRVRQTIGE
jgi:ATP-dependent Clp protease ATP-binding subunit ClpA